jgi:hypothetical protein
MLALYENCVFPHRTEMLVRLRIDIPRARCLIFAIPQIRPKKLSDPLDFCRKWWVGPFVQPPGFRIVEKLGLYSDTSCTNTPKHKLLQRINY